MRFVTLFGAMSRRLRETMKFFRLLALAVAALLTASLIHAQTWTPVQNVPPNFTAGAIALLTDGRVLVHEEGTAGDFGIWYTLTPDINGHYETGTWTQIASLPTGYGPKNFSSAVLPDGRYIIEGGQYNNGVENANTNMGAIYDPVANTWTSVNPPLDQSGMPWTSIGAAPSVVLADGTYMQTDCCDGPPFLAALLDASTLTWIPTGTGKFDRYQQEGMVLLPGGKVLDVDAYFGTGMMMGMNYEMYDPSTGAWTIPGMASAQFWESDCNPNYIGPAVLQPNGTVFQTGADCPNAGHTGMYSPNPNTWAAGPDFPPCTLPNCQGDFYDVENGPAALEINGNVLVYASPGRRNTPGQMFEWNGSTLSIAPNPPNYLMDPSIRGHLLMLPTGQIMFTDLSSDVELFTSAGNPYTGWTPTVLLPDALTELTQGSTVQLNGTNFNGASQNNAYGAFFQDATNYPLVQLTSTHPPTTGQVYYLRTHDHSTMAVGYHGPAYTHVDITSSIPTGTYTLEIVVNGLRSRPSATRIHPCCEAATQP